MDKPGETSKQFGSLTGKDNRSNRRNLRNWWITLACEGQHTIQVGPSGPEGGFSLDIDQRSGAHRSRRVITVSGEPNDNGDLVLTILNYRGERVALIVTKRDGLAAGADDAVASLAQDEAASGLYEQPGVSEPEARQPAAAKETA